ncbi:MAG: adaptor protein MecA [Lachnospiraceae bacterium]|nr:adaptor protein MecA [Lachnospiraceae bacterium]
MKIEKLSENQIRCTLTKDDLQDREIKISELAYGSEKAKSLFQDMMRQAAYEFGFEADDIPLMIEAVPLNAECIVLTITKVEDPEELDTRFAKFAPSVNTTQDSDEEFEDIDLNAFPAMSEAFARKTENVENKKDKPSRKKKINQNMPSETSQDTVKDISKEVSEKDIKKDGVSSLLFSFTSLDSLVGLAAVLNGNFRESSSLYKNPGDGTYLLLVKRGSLSLPAFQKVFLALSEYGTAVKNANITVTNLEEHFEVLIAEEAIQKIAQMV